MNIELSTQQAEFFTSNEKSTAAVAGFGSGKTDVAMYRLFTTMFENPGFDMLYLAPTFPLIRDIWYPKVEEYLLELGIKHRINRSDNIIHVGTLGSVFCRTMEHPSRIVGFEVLDAFLDELDILNTAKALEVWRKAKARCRQKCNGKLNQMYVTTTPEGFRATHQLFVKDKLPGSKLVQMSTYSNLHNLPDDYIDELKANYPPQLIEAYINGIFTNLTSGRVWTSYDRDLNKTDAKVVAGDVLIIGMDFNVGRGCAVVYVRRPFGFCAVDEFVDTLDTPNMIKSINERYLQHSITVIPDASGKSRKSVNATTSDIRLLQLAGYHVINNSSNPNIKDRVTATNAMLCNGLGERRLLVNDKTCPNFASALEQQAYDSNGMPEKGVGKFDDITDAGTYPIAELFPIASRTRKMKIAGM